MKAFSSVSGIPTYVFFATISNSVQIRGNILGEILRVTRSLLSYEQFFSSSPASKCVLEGEFNFLLPLLNESTHDSQFIESVMRRAILNEKGLRFF